jgi:hypothetical protein
MRRLALSYLKKKVLGTLEEAQRLSKGLEKLRNLF